MSCDESLNKWVHQVWCLILYAHANKMYSEVIMIRKLLTRNYLKHLKDTEVLRGRQSKNLRTMTNIREDNKLFDRVKISIGSSEFNGFPWILVTPCYQYRAL